MNNTLTDVPGIKVGHTTDLNAATGCTVILTPKAGAVCGVDIRGGGPGTRETALLAPTKHIQTVHGIVLSGGSAYGLAAADGVMQYLEAQQIGHETSAGLVPIVPAAIIYDLDIGSSTVRPSAQDGFVAAKQATDNNHERGNVGAGTGATIGKLLDRENASKGGLGMASHNIDETVIVSALVVLNALGNVVNPETNTIISGVQSWIGKTPNMIRKNKSGIRQDKMLQTPSAANTTLVVIATNALLSKSEATMVSEMAHDGLARVIYPIHTDFDGDTVFTLATGEKPLSTSLIGALAAELTSLAVLNAVQEANTLHGIKAMHP